MPATNPTLKTEALRLRTEERLSYREIGEVLGVPKGTLSGWLRNAPLTSTEKKQKMGVSSYRTPKKERGEQSSLHQMVVGNLSHNQKAKIAEAAVMLRLCLHDMNVFGSVFDGDKTDWLVEAQDHIWKVQVKWASTTNKYGLPIVPLTCSFGKPGQKRRYKKGEFNFIVGYDLFTDTAYVWSWDDVAHLKATVSVCPEAAERWDKFKGQ